MSAVRLVALVAVGAAAVSLTRKRRRTPEPPPAPPAPEPSLRARKALAGVRLVTTLAFLLVWVLVLRPVALGGPATWVLVSGNSMEPALDDGDLVLAQEQSRYRPGDVVAYRIPEGDVGGGRLIIHRITKADGRGGFVTRGDNRERDDVWRPTHADVAGRVVASAPWVGDMLGFLQAPLILASLSAVTAFVCVPGRRSPRPQP